MIIEPMEICIMPKKTQPKPARSLGALYSLPNDLDTQDLEVVKVLRYNAKALKFWAPIVVTLFLAAMTALGWLVKTALMGEINQAINGAIAPIKRDIGDMKKGQADLARKVDRIEVKQENTIKRLDKLEDKK